MGITYLVGTIKFKRLFRDPLAAQVSSCIAKNPFTDGFADRNRNFDEHFPSDNKDVRRKKTPKFQHLFLLGMQGNCMRIHLGLHESTFFKDLSFSGTVVSWDPLSFVKESQVSKPFQNDVKVFSEIIRVGYPPPSMLVANEAL